MKGMEERGWRGGGMERKGLEGVEGGDRGCVHPSNR